MGAALVPSSALLVIGAFAGAPLQVWIWLVAIVLDLLVVYLTSRGGNWRLNSATHFAERHGLVIILALGESVVAIGIGVGQLPVSTSIIIGSVLAVALAVGSWWVYFHHFAPKLEHLVARKAGIERAGLATDVYTYLHLALVAGIVVTALGVEQAMHAIEDLHVLGLFGAFALGGGIAMYIAGTAFIWLRVSGEWALIRLGGATLSVLVIPLLAVLPAIVGLAVTAVIVGVVVGAEQFFGERAKLRTGAAATAAEA
jgi:low temperature requirement protein LtrA